MKSASLRSRSAALAALALARAERAARVDHRRDLPGRLPRPERAATTRSIEIKQRVRDGAVDIGGWQLWGSNNTRHARPARARPCRRARRCPRARRTCSPTRRRPATRASRGDVDVRDRHRRHRRRAAPQRRRHGDRRGRQHGSDRRGVLPRGRRADLPDRQRQRRVRPQERARRTPTTTSPTSPVRGAIARRTAARPARHGADPCARADGIAPITSIQTLGANAAVRRQDRDGPRHRHRRRRPLRLELRRDLQGATRASGSRTPRATRRPRRRARCSSPASPRAGEPDARTIGGDITITGTIETKFGLVELVPAGVGSTSSPARARRSTLEQPSRRSTPTGNPLPAPVVLDQTGGPRPRTRSRARTTAACRACA